MLDEILEKRMSEIKDAGLLRTLRILRSKPAPVIGIEGKQYINFSSNNYLDLAGDKEISAVAAEAAEKYGCGGTSSRLIGGSLEIHERLENALAEFKNKQASLVFPSGYQANTGVISALCDKSAKGKSCIIMDRLSHASLWDGAKLAGSRIFVFGHCDMNSFEAVLKRAGSYDMKLAVTESVFSMDGDITPLKDFAFLCRKYNAVSMVDEAHSTGVFGKEGRGHCEMSGAGGEIDIITSTLSKAFGAQGGFVCSSRKLVDFLINKSRSFIYTTAVSPILCAAALKALELVKKADGKRHKLAELSSYLLEKLKSAGYDSGNSASQIVPLITGSIENTVKVSETLFKNGIFAPSVKFPTVPEGQARIRISLTAGHSYEDIEKLFKSGI